MDRRSQISLSDAQSVRREGLLQARSVRPHDGVPDCLFRQEANFTESTKLPQAHKTALNKRSYPDALRSCDEHSPARPAPALTLDSAKSVASIERHGECDLPTRRHAEESRPAPMRQCRDAPCR